MINSYLINNILLPHLTFKNLFSLYCSCNSLYLNKISYKELSKIYYTPLTNNDLKTAVSLWFINSKLAYKLYGNISNWNTLNITNMSFLFYDVRRFNCNIDDWIIANVKDFRYIFKYTIKKNEKYTKKFTFMKDFISYYKILSKIY